MVSKSPNSLGAKVGPRIAELVSKTILDTKHRLAPVEHRLRVHSMQTIIDRAGHEVADLYAPLLDSAIREGRIPEPLLTHIRKASSGKHQWQAIAGFGIGASGAPNALAQIMNNELAPGVRSVLHANPALYPDIGTVALLAAKGRITRADATDAIRSLGYTEYWANALTDAAQSMPDLSLITDLVNRQLLAPETAQAWLALAGYPETFTATMLQVRNQLLSPADYALAVLRGNISQQQGSRGASLTGVSNEDFAILIDNTGEPPAIEEMLSLWRRGHIDTSTLERAVRQSRVRDEWIPAIKQMGIIPPSPAESIEALVEGQITEQEAMKRFQEAGGDPTWFQSAYNTRGEAPSPVELGRMANRGLIPWTGTGPGHTTFEQGFHEGRWRNKWEPAMRGLAEYLPPDRTVTALAREHAITKEQAVRLWKASGLSNELVNAYWVSATTTRTSKHRELAEAQIVRLYTDQAIPEPEASSMLIDIGYDKQEASFILEIADLQREVHALEQALSRVHNLYVTFKTTTQQTSAALAQLQLPATQGEHLLKIWTRERQANVRTLTESQIASAVFYQIIPVAEGVIKLEQLGFTSEDAWIILSIRSHGPLPGKPT